MTRPPNAPPSWSKSVLLACAACLACSGSVRLAAAEATRGEYYDRLAKLPPRSADALVELAAWCASAGLGDEARECYLRAIAIDSDCVPARTALGYTKYGTGWVLPGDRKAAKRVRPLSAPPTGEGAAPATATPRAAANPPAAADPGGAETPKAAPATSAPTSTPDGSATESPETPGGAGTTPSSPPEASPDGPPAPSPGEVSPRATRIERKDEKAGQVAAAEVERKKEWAKAAGEKIAVTFSTQEDADFLIHTTLSPSSRELKTLQTNLRASKKILVGLLGLSSSVRPWPSKLQVFQVKSQTELERFAELIDGMKSILSPEGGYWQAERLVVLKPTSETVPRAVGESALLRLNDSDRPVGRWLREGVAEWVYSQSQQGTVKKHYATTMADAANTIRADPQGVRIFDLLEAADWKTQETRRNRALSFSLVDFLYRSKRRGLHDLVLAIKSDAAPAPTAEGEDEKAAHVRAISFQEEAMKAAFKVALDVLDEKWKEYVLATADDLRSREAATKAASDATKAGAARKKAR